MLSSRSSNWQGKVERNFCSSVHRGHQVNIMDSSLKRKMYSLRILEMWNSLRDVLHILTFLLRSELRKKFLRLVMELHFT